MHFEGSLCNEECQHLTFSEKKAATAKMLCAATYDLTENYSET